MATGDGTRRGPGSSPMARSRRGFRAEPVIYALFAAACTLAVALCFYSYMRLQTYYAQLDAGHLAAQMGHAGPWSAPLDDVFIHFDFARSTARGYPFQWSEGNGYSSGGTSLLYPFVLAFGYWAGFRQLALMLWAGVVACVCVFALLLASRRMFAGLPRWTSYLAPPALLCVGALDWTLLSGMEVALFLALWGGALIAWDDIITSQVPLVQRRFWLEGLILGLWGAALVATRPEGAVAVAVLGLGATFAVLRRQGRTTAFVVLLTSALPGVLVLVAQAVANRVLTGDASAAGSLVKLEMNHPYMTAHQVWDAWLFHAKYQILRATNYHFSDVPGYGWIAWGLAAVALFPRTTRRYAIVLWSSAALWVLLVALNGQVRWQNERYTMPAVAWLLLAAGLGVAVLLTHTWGLGRRGKLLRGIGIVTALAAVTLFIYHQEKRFRDQVWFFGRASRNVLEQHIRTGLVLDQLKPRPHRVLVSDAGAIPYASDLPALDLIGLGGYHKLPFARATREGVGAAVELIEHMPPAQRPDVIATYPSWWGNFVLWFGDRIGEVPVRGNVICGGAAQVLYRPDWSSLEGSGKPWKLAPGERVVDELDVADILSEKQHGYAMSKKDVGFVSMKMLPDPRAPRKPLWDAGRLIGSDLTQSFSLRDLAAKHPLRLLFRVAPAEPAAFAVEVDGQRVGVVQLLPRDGWQQPSLTVPADRVQRTLRVRLVPVKGQYILYHLWAVQRRFLPPTRPRRSPPGGGSPGGRVRPSHPDAIRFAHRVLAIARWPIPAPSNSTHLRRHLMER